VDNSVTSRFSISFHFRPWGLGPKPVQSWVLPGLVWSRLTLGRSGPWSIYGAPIGLRSKLVQSWTDEQS